MQYMRIEFEYFSRERKSVKVRTDNGREVAANYVFFDLQKRASLGVSQ